MQRFVTYFRSSVGRKALIAATGLLLFLFLGAHLAGNLLVFDGPASFNAYSHALISNPLIYAAEIGLLAIFLGHFIGGIALTVRNRRARPQRYAEKRRAGPPSRKSLASTTMILSGLVVLVFVPLHLWTFKFGPHYVAPDQPEVRDLHRLVLEVFRSPVYTLWYAVAMLVIGFHLWHGFGSAFESLGVTYRRGLRRAGHALAVIIAGGFLLIPVLTHLTGGRW